MHSARHSEWVLVSAFLAVIASVPLLQMAHEIRAGERVQFTDVFRTRPTAPALRAYEAALEEKSWFEQATRPRVQHWQFALLGHLGTEALAGRDAWVFYRPDLRYLLEPDRPQAPSSHSRWIPPGTPPTRREAVVQAIVAFRDQLRDRGIELLVVPVPGKPSIYPHQLSGRLPRSMALRSPTLGLLAELETRGVATVNLFNRFSVETKDGTGALYLARDTHWTPRGARLAAETVAQRLEALKWLSPGNTEFVMEPVPVQRRGDIPEMTRIPSMSAVYAPEAIVAEQVRHPALGLLVPAPSDRPGSYRFPGSRSEVLVLGDSFCRIYQFPEPRSLGEVPAQTLPGSGTKRLLPGSAGFVAHLARALQQPIDSIVSDGGASTDVRQKLSINPEILEGKRVVVWVFVERDIALGAAGWQSVPLPPRMDS